MLRRRDESAGEPAPRVMRRGSAWFVTLTLLLLARGPARRWAAAAPRDEAPYREWAMALGAARQQAAAREVLLAGRRALGRADAFGIELAELSQLAGDWEGAAREWSAVLTGMPVQLAAAASALADAPDAQRERIARVLTTGSPSPLARRLAGELLLGWGQAQRAWLVFEPSVATPSSDAAFALRRFADLAGARSTPDARRVRALALARDSTVDALALQGWIALYRGRLREAQDRFRSAGPFAGDREDATERTAMLALLQQVPLESFPELGGALLLLAQGDSTRAVPALRLAAERAGGAGRPAILLLAGRVAARTGGTEQQEEVAPGLFAEVVRTAGQSAAAPAAELEWARLLARRLQTADAIQHLEHLILTYPRSAVVPAARRELERARGAIPKS